MAISIYRLLHSSQRWCLGP